MEHEEREASEGLSEQVEAIARQVVDAGLAVHRVLGPGLLESVYEHCMVYELGQRRLAVRRQVPLPIVYKGAALDAGYRLDIVVGEAVILEIKSVETMSRLYEAQVLTYLRLSPFRLAFLMNFNVPLFKQGLKRYVR
ncbi:MAG TPA: GxxExxY protein [Caulobacteraceae bacterium]